MSFHLLKVETQLLGHLGESVAPEYPCIELVLVNIIWWCKILLKLLRESGITVSTLTRYFNLLGDILGY